MSRPFWASSICKCLLRTVKLPDSVFCRNTLAAIGSIPGLVPPVMMLMLAVGAMAILWLNRSFTPQSAASGQAPRSSASNRLAASACSRMCLNIRLFQTFAITLSNGMPWACRKLWNPITPRPTERSRMAA